MKIKNQAAQQSQRRQQPRKNMIANKENLSISEYKPQEKQILRRKSQFGKDITKKINEPRYSRYQQTTDIPQILIQLPSFLTKPTAFNNQISPYEEEIIQYIIQTYDTKYGEGYISRVKRSYSKRLLIIERLFRFYKKYKLKRKTFYLAVYYYDRYINIVSIQQLCNRRTLKHSPQIADACMLIAMKYEEIYPPLLKKWAPGRQLLIINIQSKILAALDFKLAQTTAQHYLEIYQGKNPSFTEEQNKLHQIVLDFYLFSANIYSQHPLKVVQQILEAFRPTSFMEKGTNYEKSDYLVKKKIAQNEKLWLYLLEIQMGQKVK